MGHWLSFLREMQFMVENWSYKFVAMQHKSATLIYDSNTMEGTVES